MPSSPPSPRGRASRIRWTSVTRPSEVTDRMRAVSRSVTSAVPSGRKASPHGAHRPVTSTRTAEAGSVASGTSLAGPTTWRRWLTQPGWPTEPAPPPPTADAAGSAWPPNQPSDRPAIPTPARITTITLTTPITSRRPPPMPPPPPRVAPSWSRQAPCRRPRSGVWPVDAPVGRSRLRGWSDRLRVDGWPLGGLGAGGLAHTVDVEAHGDSYSAELHPGGVLVVRGPDRPRVTLGCRRQQLDVALVGSGCCSCLVVEAGSAAVHASCGRMAIAGQLQ